MSIRAFAGIVGAALAVAGLVFLAMPISAPMAGGGSWSCRSGFGFGGASDAQASEYMVQRQSGILLGGRTPQVVPIPNCESVRASRMMWAWPLVGVGAIVILGAMFIEPTRPNQPRSPADNPDREALDDAIAAHAGRLGPAARGEQHKAGAAARDAQDADAEVGDQPEPEADA